MSTIKTANLKVEGAIANIIIKPSRTDQKTGQVTPEHLQINFAMLSSKGLELIKVKDINSIHKDKKDGQEVSIPVRVTMSQNGQTYYEAL
jgi:hypothetical protein